MLILDEVQTGCGRTGAFLASDHLRVDPDILCLAKGVAGGLPMGACLARPEACAFRPGDHASTFGGGPLVSAAAIVVLDELGNGLLRHVAEIGELCMQRLVKIVPEGTDVRGKGLMIGVDLPAPVAPDVVEAALDRGVLVNDVTPSTIRITPPLVITADETDEALTILEEVLDEI